MQESFEKRNRLREDGGDDGGVVEAEIRLGSLRFDRADLLRRCGPSFRLDDATLRSLNEPDLARSRFWTEQQGEELERKLLEAYGDNCSLQANDEDAVYVVAMSNCETLTQFRFLAEERDGRLVGKFCTRRKDPQCHLDLGLLGCSNDLRVDISLKLGSRDLSEEEQREIAKFRLPTNGSSDIMFDQVDFSSCWRPGIIRKKKTKWYRLCGQATESVVEICTVDHFEAPRKLHLPSPCPLTWKVSLKWFFFRAIQV